MTWLTHTAFAGLTSWIIGLPTSTSILGSTAPDWTEDLFGIHEHRGITHYLVIWFILFLFFLTLRLENLFLPYSEYLLGFVYGGLTHLFLDSLTKSGIPLGFSKIRVRIGGLITTGKPSEWIFLALILIFLTPLTRLDVKFGWNKWKDLYQQGIIDEREYDERRFKIW